MSPRIARGIPFGIALLAVSALFLSSFLRATPSPGSPYSDLVLHLAFDSVSGGIATDSSIYGHHGTIVGATTAAGKIGTGAVSFDGVNDHVVIPHAATLAPTNAITVMTWVYLDTTNTAAKILQKRGVFTDTNGGYMLGSWFGNPRGYAFEIYDTGNAQRIIYPNPERSPSTRVWTHVAATFDGSSLALYENGQLQNTVAYSGTIGASTKDLFIGIQPDNNLMPFKGMMDEVKIYNRALTAPEVDCAFQQKVWVDGACAVAGTNRAPVSEGVAGPVTVATDTTGTWSVTTYDPDREVVSVSATWGDGTTSTATSDGSQTKATLSLDHQYRTSGTYIPLFTITDSRGRTATAAATTVIAAAPQITPTADGLLSHWRFDGNGANEVANGPMAVAMASATFQPSGGKLGGYAYVPSQNDWVKVPYHPAFDLRDAFTVAFWFRQRSNQSFLQRLVYKGSAPNSYNFSVFRQLWDQYNFGPVITGFTSQQTGYWTQTSNANQLAHGEWHHVVFTKSSSGAAYYLDGVRTNANTQTDQAVTPANEIIIGDSAVDTDFDDLRIYNRALSFSEAVALGGFPAPTPTVTALLGPTTLTVGQTDPYAVRWSVTVSNPLRRALSLTMTWGDGQVTTHAGQQVVVPEVETFALEHAYTVPGTYTVTAVARDSSGATSPAAVATVTVVRATTTTTGSGTPSTTTTTGTSTTGTTTTSGTNTAPQISALSGPQNLGINAVGTWTLTLTNAELDALLYDIDWGDVTKTMSSVGGTPAATLRTNVSHQYAAPGTYTITFAVKDAPGLRSEWVGWIVTVSATTTTTTTSGTPATTATTTTTTTSTPATTTTTGTSGGGGGGGGGGTATTTTTTVTPSTSTTTGTATTSATTTTMGSGGGGGTSTTGTTGTTSTSTTGTTTTASGTPTTTTTPSIGTPSTTTSILATPSTTTPPVAGTPATTAVVPVTTAPVRTGTPSITPPVSGLARDQTIRELEARIQELENILAEATKVFARKVDELAQAVGRTQDIALEQRLDRDLVTRVVSEAVDEAIRERIVGFVTYGTETTVGLGAGERAGVVNSFRSTFGREPGNERDWADTVKIANGRFPSQTNPERERAVEEAFRRIYRRAPDRSHANDNAAIFIMAYGLRPEPRNTASEAVAIGTFRKIFGRSPTSAADWDAVRAIAYSGARR